MSIDADDDLYDAIDAAKQKLVGYYNASSELSTAATLLDLTTMVGYLKMSPILFLMCLGLILFILLRRQRQLVPPV